MWSFRKPATSEINLGRRGLVGDFLRILSAEIVQQCLDTLMVALNSRAWPVQLYEARQNLQRRNWHDVLLFSRRSVGIERKAGQSNPAEQHQRVNLFSDGGNATRMHALEAT
ncbi:hypothetical protein [Bradyrhizobium sp. STM 3843]|uniref:hypothetical protein n=1 Tax=Bradyrhizobium sp. STM 3843 TaxID=551947 RepID=UPI001586E0B4|nr:hypothetical protein [Bradyrhizobium sp. STM 3843]